MAFSSLEQKIESNLQEIDTPSLTIKPITVLIVEDHALVRAAISHALASESEVKRVVMVRNYVEAEKEALHLHPDIIWLDMHITHSPNNGIVEIGRLRKLSPESRIIVFTDIEDEHEAFAVIMAGAQGYCSKQDVDPNEIILLIRMIYCSETVLRPTLMTRVIHRLRTAALPLWGAENTQGDPMFLYKKESNGIEQLTVREREVLQFISRGCRDRDIARELHIAEKTVQKHVQSVLGKLGVQNRTEAAYLIHQQVEM